MDERLEKLAVDYTTATQTYQGLADIRFKLLAFVPGLSGAAVALLSRSDLDRWASIALASLGFIVTLGIVIYDQRNSQFYDGAVSRAQHLERELQLQRFDEDKHYGLFGSRKDHKRKHFFFIPVNHGVGLSLVYAPVLGVWAFAVVDAAVNDHVWIAALVGSVVAAACFVHLLVND